MSTTLRTPAADADTGGSSLQAASRILTLLDVIYLTLLSSGLVGSMGPELIALYQFGEQVPKAASAETLK